MNLNDWLPGKHGILSADADFFTFADEQLIAPEVIDYLTRKIAAGAEIAFRDEHVALIDLVARPVDFIINFDFHMDCRVEYLHGAPAKVPPCNATVFEHLLSSGLAERYIWGFPNIRAAKVASVYASAFIESNQPLLTRIHCIPGHRVLKELLELPQIDAIFVCRSPDYATANTDAILQDLHRRLQ